MSGVAAAMHVAGMVSTQNAQVYRVKDILDAVLNCVHIMRILCSPFSKPMFGLKITYTNACAWHNLPYEYANMLVFKLRAHTHTHI